MRRSKAHARAISRERFREGAGCDCRQPTGRTYADRFDPHCGGTRVEAGLPIWERRERSRQGYLPELARQELCSLFANASFPRGKTQMKGPFMIVGLALIILGVLAFAYQGITYTTREKVLEIGPITATKESTRTIPLPPVLGGIALAGGVALLLVSARR